MSPEFLDSLAVLAQAQAAPGEHAQHQVSLGSGESVLALRTDSGAILCSFSRALGTLDEEARAACDEALLGVTAGTRFSSQPLIGALNPEGAAELTVEVPAALLGDRRALDTCLDRTGLRLIALLDPPGVAASEPAFEPEATLDTRVIPLENPGFRRLLAAIAVDAGAEVELTSPGRFEMLTPDDVPVHVTVHPDGSRIVVDAFIYNAAFLTGPLRASMVQSLLLLNHVALRGRRFAVGLDSRHLVFVTASFPLDVSTAETFAEDLAYITSQAVEIRGLVEAVTLAGAEIPVTLEAGTASAPLQSSPMEVQP